MMDAQQKKGKKVNRTMLTLIMGFVALVGSTIVSADGLGSTGMWNPLLATLGADSGKVWLDVFDLFAEGLLMPLGGLLMAIMFGWTRRLLQIYRSCFHDLHLLCTAQLLLRIH